MNKERITGYVIMVLLALIAAALWMPHMTQEIDSDSPEEIIKKIDQEKREDNTVLKEPVQAIPEEIISSLMLDLERIKEKLRNSTKMNEELVAYNKALIKDRSELALKIRSHKTDMDRLNAKFNRLTELKTITKIIEDAPLKEVVENEKETWQHEATEERGWYTVATIVDPLERRIKYNIEVRNEYDIVEFEKKGKKYVKVINYNPYSTTSGSNTFLLSKEKVKRIGLGVQLGYGANKSNLSPYVGIGLSYNIISI